MIENYDGQALFDAAGNQVGTIERTFDTPDGHADLVEVKIGTLLAKHRLVPVSDAQPSEDGLKVNYGKQTIENSPDASNVEHTLEGDLLDQVRAYYEGKQAAALPAS